jgi:NADH-quinone oxidoreductase subunit D
MTPEQAVRIGAIGPTARASGLNRDVRVNAPYAGYVDFPVQIVTAQGGDLLARTIVRVNELFESIRLIRLIIEKLPPGELTVRMPRRVPEGAVVSRVEAPRGELFYYMRSGGGDKPERVKVRTPSICNWATVMAVAIGHNLADMPMLLAGIDPCFSCSDRSVSVVRAGKEEHLTWEALRQYGIGYYK